MATKVYGCSDDLIEFEGDIEDEVGFFDGDDGALLVFSDGTILLVQYDGEARRGIWAFTVICTGSLFAAITVCEDPDAELYSDVVTFRDGLRRAYVATSWQSVGAR